MLDGSDNFATRLTVSDTATRLRIPLVSAAAARFQAQVALFRGWEADKPCYRCFVGDAFDADDCDNCAEVGVLGALTGDGWRFRRAHGNPGDRGGRRACRDRFTSTKVAASWRQIRVPKDPGAAPVEGRMRRTP